MNVRLSLIIALAVFYTSSIYGALPPYAAAERKKALMESVKQSREKTEQIITMKVIKLKRDKLVLDECPSIEKWNVEAIVEDVQKGYLKKGDHIEISYSEEVYECPGPQRYYLKELKKEMSTSAYLKCIDKECTISADAWSFDSEEEFSKEYIEITDEDAYWKLNR